MEISVDGNTMIIKVQLTPPERAPLSSTGKNKVLYSSGGFTQVDRYRVNLSVIPGR